MFEANLRRRKDEKTRLRCFSAPMLGGIGGIFGISRDGITFVSMPYSCIGGERRSDQTYDRSERLLWTPEILYFSYIDAAAGTRGSMTRDIIH